MSDLRIAPLTFAPAKIAGPEAKPYSERRSEFWTMAAKISGASRSNATGFGHGGPQIGQR